MARNGIAELGIREILKKEEGLGGDTSTTSLSGSYKTLGQRINAPAHKAGDKILLFWSFPFYFAQGSDHDYYYLKLIKNPTSGGAANTVSTGGTNITSLDGDAPYENAWRGYGRYATVTLDSRIYCYTVTADDVTRYNGGAGDSIILEPAAKEIGDTKFYGTYGPTYMGIYLNS